MPKQDRYPPCQAYPPVPNWYTSYAGAISEPHFYVYATRNVLVVLDLDRLRFVKAFIASIDKIQAIAVHDKFCFAGGVDTTIRGWNVLDGSLLATYTGHKDEVTVIRCVRDGTLLVSGDKSGKVIVQDAFGHRKRVYNKVNAEVRAIAPLRHLDQDYVAIGYANGFIFVEKIDDELEMSTEYQLVHPEDGVLSLAWQRKVEPPAWPLLASSSRRSKTAVVWNVPDESRLGFLEIPFPPAQATETQRNTLWLELAWSPVSKDHLYLSSYGGNILCYEMQERNIRLANDMRFLPQHTRVVFNMIFSSNGKYAITTSLDKQIIKWDVKKRDAQIRMRTHMAYPYSIDIPGWNPDLAAVGLGDSNIKIWTFARTPTVDQPKNLKRHNFYETQLLWKDIQGQVQHVQWHPTKEGLLLYSTEYGRIGIYDVYNHKGTKFKTYHAKKGPSPFIAWAGDLSFAFEDVSMPDVVISCGADGRVYAFDALEVNRPPIDMDERFRHANPAWNVALEAKLKTARCCFALDDQRRFIALGNTDGSIEVYRLDTFKIVFISNSHPHEICAMAWNNRSWLAVGSSHGHITVHDIGSIDIESVPDIPVPEISPLHKLYAHSKRITDLKWSRHADKALLASASLDETVFVWNMENGQKIAAFYEHRGAALSVCWGISDEDMVISGGDDRFLYMWKYTDYITDDPKKRPTSRTVEETRILEAQKREIEEVPETFGRKRRKIATTTTTTTATATAAQAKSSGLMTATKKAPKAVQQTVLLQMCLKRAASLYGGDVKEAVEYVTSRIPVSVDPAEFKEYATLLQGEEGEEAKLLDLLFGDKNDIRELIGMEVEQVTDAQPINAGEDYAGLNTKLALQVMRSHYTEFDICASTNQIDWVTLALSPMAGKETWLKLMEEQAKRLAQSGRHVAAATCYLACSKVYDAVAVYRSAELYSEAIALAKLRLPADDSLIASLYMEWADKLQAKGQQELAAMCFLQGRVGGSTVNAINALTRRPREPCLFWAACLAYLLKDSTAEERISRYLDMLMDRVSHKENSSSNDAAAPMQE